MRSTGRVFAQFPLARRRALLLLDTRILAIGKGSVHHLLLMDLAAMAQHSHPRGINLQRVGTSIT